MTERIFIPTENGSYEEIHLPSGSNGSINDIGLFLGYNPNQIYCYLGAVADNKDFSAIIFKKFSKSVLALIVTNKYHQLTQKDVNNFLKDFDYDSEYSTYNRESDLEDAIVSGSLSRQFFCDVLDLPYLSEEGDTPICDLLNGYYYFFEDNILKNYEPLEKLSGWAKEFKETSPQFFNEIKQFAQDYWGNDEKKVYFEIEGQFDAFANIPHGFRNDKLTHFHLRGDYVYNFKILETVVTGKPISLKEFLFFTHNEARLINSRDTTMGIIHTYIYRNFFFQFTEEGEFVRCLAEL